MMLGILELLMTLHKHEGAHRGGQSNLMLYNSDRTNQLGFIVPADVTQTVVKVYSDPRINIRAVEEKLGGHGNPDPATLPTTEEPLCAACCHAALGHVRYNCHTDQELMAQRFCKYHEFERAQSYKTTACHDCSCAVYNVFEGSASNPGRRLDGSHSMVLSEITCVKDAVVHTHSSWIHVANFWDANQWTHACVSVDETGTMRAFKNGKEMKCTNVGESACNANGIGSNGKVPNRAHRSKSFIGRASVPVSEEYFNGAISDLRFIDGRAIVAEQDAAEIMRGYLTTNTSTPATTATVTTNRTWPPTNTTRPPPLDVTTSISDMAVLSEDGGESDYNGSNTQSTQSVEAANTLDTTTSRKGGAVGGAVAAIIVCSMLGVVVWKREAIFTAKCKSSEDIARRNVAGPGQRTTRRQRNAFAHEEASRNTVSMEMNPLAAANANAPPAPVPDLNSNSNTDVYYSEIAERGGGNAGSKAQAYAEPADLGEMYEGPQYATPMDGNLPSDALYAVPLESGGVAYAASCGDGNRRGGGEGVGGGECGAGSPAYSSVA